MRLNITIKHNKIYTAISDRVLDATLEKRGIIEMGFVQCSTASAAAKMWGRAEKWGGPLAPPLPAPLVPGVSGDSQSVRKYNSLFSSVPTSLKTGVQRS